MKRFAMFTLVLALLAAFSVPVLAQENAKPADKEKTTAVKKEVKKKKATSTKKVKHADLKKKGSSKAPKAEPKDAK